MNAYDLGKYAALEKFAVMTPQQRRLLYGSVGGSILGGLTDIATAPEEQGYAGPALRGALVGGVLGLGAGSISNQLGARWGEPKVTVRRKPMPQSQGPAPGAQDVNDLNNRFRHGLIGQAINDRQTPTPEAAPMMTIRRQPK